MFRSLLQCYNGIKRIMEIEHSRFDLLRIRYHEFAAGSSFESTRACVQSRTSWYHEATGIILGMKTALKLLLVVLQILFRTSNCVFLNSVIPRIVNQSVDFVPQSIGLSFNLLISWSCWLTLVIGPVELQLLLQSGVKFEIEALSVHSQEK
ncbi:hypothetical protein L6452_12406 [Arctium lappa]|uniref:Uncharacterized protein n=1 Tax=Arctium lappa TaxID=4217 RepID=A0ACB9DRN2_ARCLA|nr:hypothetical protein L6452_12406 [Arctium lappa]